MAGLCPALAVLVRRFQLKAHQRAEGPPHPRELEPHAKQERSLLRSLRQPQLSGHAHDVGRMDRGGHGGELAAIELCVLSAGHACMGGMPLLLPRYSPQSRRRCWMASRTLFDSVRYREHRVVWRGVQDRC